MMAERRLKIAVVVDAFPVISETFIVNQITYLIDQGHDVKILSYKRGDRALVNQAVIDYSLIEKCIWYAQPRQHYVSRVIQMISILVRALKQPDWNTILNAFNIFKHGRQVLNLRVPFQAQWFLKKYDFDIIHIHFANNAIPFANLYSSGLIRSIPMIVSFHGYDLAPDKLLKLKESYRDVLLTCSALTVNSQYTKALLDEIYDGDKVIILPEGLETGKFTKHKTKLQRAVDDVTLLFCGRLINWKAPDIAIAIVQELVVRNYRNVRLRIIGDGPLREPLISQIENSQLQNQVSLLGALTQEQIIDELAGADVFLFPGIHDPETQRAENQGLVIQEAQSMQLPVIVSDAGGMKYGMKDQVTGFVIKQRDIQGFADKIELLINDPALRIKMGEEGRKYVAEKFDMKVLGASLVGLYGEMLSDQSFK